MSALQGHSEWLEARRKGVGASEAGAILGLSPWRTALEVYLDKLGLLPIDSNPPARLKWGLRMERVIAEAYTEETGRSVEPGCLVVHPDAPWMLSTTDYMASDRPVELKRIDQFNAKEFGEPGTEDIPRLYYLQVQQQMACTGKDVADLAALIGQADFRIYTIRRNVEVIEQLIVVEREFMEAVERQEPPLPDFAHSTTLNILSLIEPETGKAIELGADAANISDQFESFAEAESRMRKNKDEQKARLIHLMGDAETAWLPDGRRIVRKTVERKGYSVEPTSYVSFSIKKAAAIKAPERQAIS